MTPEEIVALIGNIAGRQDIEDVQKRQLKEIKALCEESALSATLAAEVGWAASDMHLRAALDVAREDAKEWEEVAMDIATEYAEDFERLTNEIDRYKTALEKIAHTDDADGPPHLWVRIARTALEIK